MQQQQPGNCYPLTQACAAASICYDLTCVAAHCSHLSVLLPGGTDAPKGASLEKDLSVKIPEPVNRGSFSHQGQLLSPEPSANSSTNYDADRWGRSLLSCCAVALQRPLALSGSPLVT